MFIVYSLSRLVYLRYTCTVQFPLWAQAGRTDILHFIHHHSYFTIEPKLCPFNVFIFTTISTGKLSCMLIGSTDSLQLEMAVVTYHADQNQSKGDTLNPGMQVGDVFR